MIALQQPGLRLLFYFILQYLAPIPQKSEKSIGIGENHESYLH